jgi:hypothetical protein
MVRAMRLRFALAVVLGAIVVAGVVWGLSGALLAFFYAIPVLFIATVAAKRSDPPSRVRLNIVLWLTTRPLAFFVGYAWWGWIGAAALLAAVLVPETVAMRASRRVVR